MRENHIVGITAAIDNPDYQRILDAGVRWLRFGFGFPYADAGLDTLSTRFEQDLEKALRLQEMGFSILGTTASPGSMRYDEEQKKTIWKSGLPQWAGTIDEDRYYEIYTKACNEMAKQTAGLVSYWQIANEPDIDIFRGPLTDDQIVRFLLSGARGIKAGNPEAKPGINLGFITDYSRWLMKSIYALPDSPFEYLGLDGYFGSWQPGGPEDWPAYIDETYAITKCPIIINEWGYSSLGSTPKDDDPELKKHYNQNICRSKSWDKVWNKEHSPAEQAAYLKACMKIFVDHPQVIGNFFFRWSDTPTCWQCGQSGCPAECAWGLVDVQGNPKPAYFALKESIQALFT